jgi:hypothetical protein
MRRLLALVLSTLMASACANAEASPETAGTDATPDRVVGTSSLGAGDAAQELPTLLVYKTSTCLCCQGWVEHLEAAGFSVDARDVSAQDLMRVKMDGGIPNAMSSCHSAIVDGYMVEGHVPADQIRRLLAERPDVAGIGAPGMPMGSPGMEGPNAKPYEVLSFTHDGQTAVFAIVDPR